MLQKATDLGRRVVSAIELRDVLFVGGFWLMWAGGSQLSSPWTKIGLGALLVLVAIPKRRA